jgi:hypothetical protein
MADGESSQQILVPRRPGYFLPTRSGILAFVYLGVGSPPITQSGLSGDPAKSFAGVALTGIGCWSKVMIASCCPNKVTE